MSMTRLGGVVVGLAVAFAAAWLIGHASRPTVAAAVTSPSSLPRATVQRAGASVADVPAAVALPKLAVAHPAKSAVAAPSVVASSSPAQSPQVQPSQSSAPSSSRASGSQPSAGGGSGTSHVTSTSRTSPPPVVGGGN